ncbi:hypothetical protein RCH16_003147 [Cryobacterium sp. MP_M5]|nr:hypothetical protein [Cryobacterium sp. MP_M3]MEC5178116.1 hypothetical protein [Cryobacterium sp. MP_M5]
MNLTPASARPTIEDNNREDLMPGPKTVRHALSPSATQRNVSASVNRMAERIRRARGSVQQSPIVYGRVSPEAKAIVIDTADTLGISQARAIEAILLALPLDPDGVPTAIDRELFESEERPISAP